MLPPPANPRTLVHDWLLLLSVTSLQPGGAVRAAQAPQRALQPGAALRVGRPSLVGRAEPEVRATFDMTSPCGGACTFMSVCVCVCGCLYAGLSTEWTEGTEESFPLPFDPGLWATNQESCVFSERGAGWNPPLSVLVRLLQPYPSPRSQPFCLLYKTEEEHFCASKQVQSLRFLFALVFLFCFLQNNYIVTYRTRESVEY